MADPAVRSGGRRGHRPKPTTVLAVDLGAGSGRVAAVTARDDGLDLEVIHRFPNQPVDVRGSLHWDVLALYSQVRTGIGLGRTLQPASLGVDAWGVDFALLDGSGELLGNPHHHRDRQFVGALARLFRRVDRSLIYGRTGIQFLPFNTSVQLFALAERGDPRLEVASTFLTIPDLLHYWLTGARACEFTNATTTQLLNARARSWDEELMAHIGVRPEIFPDLAEPGTSIGSHDGVSVTLPASHDTGSAVVGVPVTTAEESIAFLSSGTWSLVGTEVPEPILTPEALAAGVTNEGGAGGGYRLLKNVMGLWVLQQCRETWAKEGNDMTYAELARAAASEPVLRSVVPVNDATLLAPGDHPAAIRRLCEARGEPVPETVGQVVRCVIDSLALAYREVIGLVARLTGRSFEVIHVVGGGAANDALNQATADATGLPVLAGPTEATLLGNAITQLVSLGVVGSLAEGRARVAHSHPPRRFEPSGSASWTRASERLGVDA